tara:strand:- start:41 stop:1471 length:1431 start_codon:yes stop_codon:yes gene_type:complete
MTLTKISTPGIKDEAITLAKLLHGDANSNGKFLRANNGADPTFETITGTTINNNADNRVITGSGSANTLNAESDVIIDSNGHLGVGGAPDFEFQVTDSSGAAVIRAKDGANNKVVDLIANSTGGLLRTIGAYPLVLNTNQTERMRIDASGGVKIGETNSGAVRLSLTQASNGGLMISGGVGFIPTDGQTIGDIGFSSYSDSSTNSNAEAMIRAVAAGNHSGSSAPTNLLFFTKPSSTGPGSSPTERMRIDKDGNVGIGMTPAAPLHVTGATADTLRLTNGGSTSIYYKIGRNHADGKLEFRGTQSGDECYSFGGVSGEKIRFQPAGGISFNGDTAAANALDDYEEGTWTPTLNNGGGFSTNNTVGKYTKIGRVVHWVCQVAGTRNSSSPSGVFTISGLPFTSLNQATGGHGYAGCMGALYNWNVPNGAYQIGIRVPDNTSYIQFFANNDNAADGQLTSPFDANKTVFGSLSGTYIT